MKILQIGATFKDGGPGYTAAIVHEGLIQHGIQSKVFYGSGASSASEDVIKYESKFNEFTRRLVMRTIKNFPVTASIQTILLIKKITSYNPDIIHLRIIHHAYINYIHLFKFLAKYGKPVVFTLHDMWIMTGGCYHYKKANCEEFLKSCEKCPLTKEQMDNSPLFSSIYRKKKEELLLKVSDLYIQAVSEWCLQEVSRSYLHGRKSFLISNAVDVNVFKPYRERDYFDHLPPSNKIVLGVATKWSESKGYSRFCELAKFLGQEYSVCLIGNPPHNQETHPNNLFLLGQQKNRIELAKAYSSADVFVHMSSEETFGMVIAEAASCGTIVIGFDSTGISEVVRKAKGILVPDGAVVLISEEVKNVCIKNKNLSEAELEAVRNGFSNLKMQYDHILMYRSIYASEDGISDSHS